MLDGVLIIGGIVDIGFGIYCITNKIGYSSSFNIFTVIAGIFLIRGSLRAARIISLFLAFFISAFIALLIAVPFLLPLDLLYTHIRLATASVSVGIIFISAVMVLLVWAYRKLTSPPVCAAMDDAEINYTSFWRKPARGFWYGGCLALSLLIFFSVFMSGITSDEAKRKATVEVGTGYKFHVKSLSVSSGTGGKHVHAVITAYNDTEIKDVIVKWSE